MWVSERQLYPHISTLSWVCIHHPDLHAIFDPCGAMCIRPSNHSHHLSDWNPVIAFQTDAIFADPTEVEEGPQFDLRMPMDYPQLHLPTHRYPNEEDQIGELSHLGVPRGSFGSSYTNNLCWATPVALLRSDPRFGEAAYAGPLPFSAQRQLPVHPV